MKTGIVILRSPSMNILRVPPVLFTHRHPLRSHLIFKQNLSGNIEKTTAPKAPKNNTGFVFSILQFSADFRFSPHWKQPAGIILWAKISTPLYKQRPAYGWEEFTANLFVIIHCPEVAWEASWDSDSHPTFHPSHHFRKSLFLRQTQTTGICDIFPGFAAFLRRFGTN